MRCLIAFCLLTVAACAHAPEPVPETDPLLPATLETEPPDRVEVVAVPKPLPLPGQLKPWPKPAEEETVEPADRIDQTRQKAAYGPAQGHAVNAIQVYPYVQGALYQVFAAVGQVTDIALAVGETITSVSAGDTVRWVVGDTTSGEGETLRQHVLVKPVAAGLATNLAILTNRRAYHLELTSTDGTYMAAVSWDYPKERLLALKREQARAQAVRDRTAEPSLDIVNLTFAYRIQGDSPRWRPVRAFDDGTKTYIQFPRDLATTEAPPLFVLTEKGETALVNYRVRGRYYIVDRLFARAELRLGEKPQSIVRIVREGPR